MSGFDDLGVFFSDNFGSEDQQDGNQINRQEIKNNFKAFLRKFHEGNFSYEYRSFSSENSSLGSEKLQRFEDAAKEVADEITQPRPEGEEIVQDIQVTLASNANATALRNLKSDQMARLVKMSGIVIAASTIKAKATKLAIQCRGCRNVINNISVKPGLEGYSLPRKCNTQQAGVPKCPVDPYFIMPDKCKCVDFQILRLQENPEDVPNGELPRHMQLYCDRYLCDKIVPGNRVSVLGIFSIKKMGYSTKKSGRDKVNVGIRAPYFRVLGISVDTQGDSKTTSLQITPEDEEELVNLANSPNLYDIIAKSIAPSIWGSLDVKKAIACLLFGGSRKRLPDGLTRRGDVNLLMLGDPGTAKSQLLKFVEQVSPIGVYTSGKGSSAAGLTASVIRDPQSRGFIMEGGAMVLADGGVVCIDEFDKMREDDRVAIHEAMEQQTISIAKAGITTTLNSRCSVLAAANSVFGRWDDTKGEENIDFMPTILSRFDMIFIIKDEHDENRDVILAKHVMNVHLNSLQQKEKQEGELSIETLKKYIAYCRLKCGPRISVSAAEKLRGRYVLLRNGASEYERETGKKISIPITVRQLEAIVRISESLAKMRLEPFATDSDVDEALRLFQVSTLDAAMSGHLAGVEGFSTEADQELLSRIEKQMKRRFVIGSQVSEYAIVQDFLRQNYPENAIYKVLGFMLRRGEIQHRMQRKMLYRIK
ncbi:DNA replication licensing factor mcm5-A [Octopus bimaculoides]|uniref:DNA replication licensing factor mcm5-A n=1 Tax=Octopus bimaculoides TaxID=37653 RepID=UPI00071C2044|nr:DNA replication licensing factor mcm5-A [Octopus bimaculoides]|eukprot:XP_014767470.1 PREDICTED: DNA replication licensing factor mcm5-A-like [Octopus bimaculoides]